MHALIKETKNAKYYIYGDNYMIYYYESKNDVNLNKAVYYIEHKEIVALDEKFEYEDFKEFIQFLDDKKFPINDFRYI